MTPSRTTLIGLGVICFANLLLEVVITRIFSATMFYHFTFLAVALALFGVAASGVFVFTRGDRFTDENVRAEMAKYARRFALATILTLVYVLANPIDIILVTGTNQVPEFTNKTFWQLVLLVAMTALPFFFAGVVVSLAITFFRKDINRVYFYDLAGAALAAMAAGLLLGIFGGPTLVLVIALLALGGAALFHRPKRLGWLPIAAAAALVVWNLAAPIIKVPTVKGVKAEKVAFEKWNVFSRVTVDSQKMIKIDASAATEIRSRGDVKDAPYDKEISAYAHAMFDGGAEQVLIIGPGGGRDVVHALSAGARHVTGVEVNPIIAESIMKDEFADENGDLYRDERVNVVVDDGRSFVRRSEERYDLIQASLVDTWAATAAGAFALTENTLYTVEAFEDYFSHLSERGALTMTRWHTGGSGETARLLLLAAGTLEKLGVPPSQVRQHLVYVRQPKGSLGTMVAKRQPFTADELARLEAAAKAGGFAILVSPTTPGTDRLERLVDAGAWSSLVASADEDLSPPTDDRPFFFYFKRWGDLFPPSTKMNDPGLWILVSLGSVLALSMIFIVMPLLVRGASALRGARGERGTVGRRGLALLYFALVGLAFMVVEIAMLQKCALFLGHPSYSLVVVLFSVLIATAVGARLAGRFRDAQLGKVMLAGGLGVTALALLYAFALAPLLQAWVAWPLFARIALSALIVGAAGLLMGVMVPAGVRVVSQRDAALVPWAWGVNGATSVIGTVVATVVAIYGGFTTTLIGGAIVYALAAGVGVLLTRLAAAGAGAGSPVEASPDVDRRGGEVAAPAAELAPAGEGDG